MDSTKRKLTFVDIMSVTRSLMGLMVQFVCYFCMSYNTPLLTTHLDDLGFSPAFMGLSLVSVSISYGTMITCVPCLTRMISKRGCIMIGMIIMNVGINITGWFNRGDWRLTAFFTIMGLIIFGGGAALVTIPIMPEILESIESSPKF